MQRCFPEPSGEEAADVRNPFFSNATIESVPDEMQDASLDQRNHSFRMGLLWNIPDAVLVCYAAIITEPKYARLSMSASIRFYLPLSAVV